MEIKLNDEQAAVVNATESKIVVIAAASSGKTQVLTARLQHLLDSGVNPEEIVAITFTNAAAANMRERLREKYPGLFMGTVHSYANNLLLSYGVPTHDLIKEEKFDKLFERVKSNPGCIKHVSHLLVDESQDCSDSQLSFFEMIKPDNFMLVGDPRQSIYRFNGGDPQYIIDLSHQSDVTTYQITGNYRCGSKILNYARNIIALNGSDYRDNSVAMRKITGSVIEVELSYEALTSALKNEDDLTSWFILCRTNDQVETMCNALARHSIPHIRFRKADLTTSQEMEEKLHENKVKVMTIHASKGLEADNVIVIGARFYDVEEKCLAYVAATRARNRLIWTHQKYKQTRSCYTRNLDSWER